MTALASILTDDRLHVDVARQIRVWSGTLRDDKDYEDAIPEIIAIYAPPEEHMLKAPAKDNDEPTAFEGMDALAAFNSATQNAAFGVNMPRFDVRQQLKDIKVEKSTDLRFSIAIDLTQTLGSYSRCCRAS